LSELAPTRRAVIALAVIALTALILPWWVPVACALILVAACGVDAFSVREPPALERQFPRTLSRGVSAGLRVSAAAEDGRTVLLRQPATPWLVGEPAVGRGELTGSLTPLRRGLHDLPPVASASVGGLGLARVHHPVGAPEQLRVYPNLVAARALTMRLRLRNPGGRVARGPLGLGTDFESVREYSPNDDIRQLNWRASARLGRPMSNQYRVERDRDVICLLDTGRLMAAPVGTRTMLDAALDALTALALGADELGDRSGAIAFADGVRAAVAPRHLAGRAVIESLFALEPEPVDSDFELAFARVGRSRRAFVIVFTDLVDEAAARSLLSAMPMLAQRHAVSVASVVDPALRELAEALPTSPEAIASKLVALDVLEARGRDAARLRRLGAAVIEAPAEELAERSLDAYLNAKARARV
jgi:uncharacterized protein (DUF58 family)